MDEESREPGTPEPLEDPTAMPPEREEPVPYEPPVVATSEPAARVDQVVTPRRSLFLARFIQALWLGSGAFLMFLAAPAAFRAAGSPTAAAEVVGAMLNRWHYLALIAPALLVLIEWHRMRPRVVTLLFVAIVAAALQAGFDLRIRTIREQAPVAISSLPNTSPLRRHFGVLHGISSVLMLVQLVTAVGAIVVEPDTE